MSRWNILFCGRVGGERVLEKGDTMINTTDWRKIGHRGAMKRYRKLVETGGAGGLE